MTWIYSMSRTVTLLYCCFSVQTGNSQSATNVLQSSASINNAITEQTTSSIDHQISDIDQRISRLESQLQAINANLKQVLEATPTVSELRTKNDDLSRMLENFERFFGSLYAEKPEAFNPDAAVEFRMSKLNEYLGNREAELAGLRPSPMTVVDSHETFDPELLGKVLAQITEQNSKLAETVQSLQSKVDIAIPRKDESHVDVKVGMRGRRHVRDVRLQNTTDDDIIEISEERVTTVERKVALEMANFFQNLSDSSSWNSGPTTDTDIIDESLTIEEEIDMLAEDIFGVPTSSRKRKSAFSTASTMSMYGTSEPQVVIFDHVYVNKGRDFDVDNNTFVCEITGFYFISFNFRSFDGRHLGVALMKNHDVMTAIYTDASERNVMESQSLILHLVRGDRVFLRLGPSENYGIYSDSFKYSTFSGFLLYRGN